MPELQRDRGAAVEHEVARDGAELGPEALLRCRKDVEVEGAHERM